MKKKKLSTQDKEITSALDQLEQATADLKADDRDVVNADQMIEEVEERLGKIRPEQPARVLLIREQAGRFRDASHYHEIVAVRETWLILSKDWRLWVEESLHMADEESPNEHETDLFKPRSTRLMDCPYEFRVAAFSKLPMLVRKVMANVKGGSWQRKGP